MRNTGLNEILIKNIGTALKKARSLLSVHLSGNPGVTEDNLEFLFNRIACKKPEVPEITEDLNALLDEQGAN